MAEDKNPQEITPTFLRKLPGGKTEKINSAGEKVSGSTQQASTEAPALRTGDLPKNVTASGKLAAANITTYEALREATTEQLTAAGLDDEQIASLESVKNATVKV